MRKARARALRLGALCASVRLVPFPTKMWSSSSMRYPAPWAPLAQLLEVEQSTQIRVQHFSPRPPLHRRRNHRGERRVLKNNRFCLVKPPDQEYGESGRWKLPSEYGVQGNLQWVIWKLGCSSTKYWDSIPSHGIPYGGQAVRIAARLGFHFTKEVSHSLKELSCSVLLRLDKARILMELNSMLAFGSAEASLRFMWKFGLLEILFPIQAAYFVSQGFRRSDKRSNMLLL